MDHFPAAIGPSAPIGSTHQSVAMEALGGGGGLPYPPREWAFYSYPSHGGGGGVGVVVVVVRRGSERGERMLFGIVLRHSEPVPKSPPLRESPLPHASDV